MLTPNFTTKNEEFSLLDFLLLLAARKSVIIICTAVFTLSAIVASLLLPSYYAVSASILPPLVGPPVQSTAALGVGEPVHFESPVSGDLDIGNPNDMYVAMFLSHTVEDAVIQQLHLMEEYHTTSLSDARSLFEHNSAVDDSNQDGLIRISVEDRSPQRATAIANNYVYQCNELLKNLALEQAKRRQNFFYEQLGQTKDSLAKAEAALERTERTTGLIQPRYQTQALIDESQSLQSQLVSQKAQIQRLLAFATSQNPELVRERRELASVSSHLDNLNEAIDDRGNNTFLSNGHIPATNLEYSRRQREFQYYEELHRLIAINLGIAKIDEARKINYFQFVDSPSPSHTVYFPKRRLIVIGGILSGFFLGVFGVLITEYLRKSG